MIFVCVFSFSDSAFLFFVSGLRCQFTVHQLHVFEESCTIPTRLQSITLPCAVLENTLIAVMSGWAQLLVFTELPWNILCEYL